MKKKRNMKRWYKRRQSLVDDYRAWFWARIVKVLAVLIIMGIFSTTVHTGREAKRANVAFKDAQTAGRDAKSDPDFRRHMANAKAIPPMLQLTSVVLSILLLPLLGMCQELQNTSQNGIDDVLLGKPTMHLAEIFPHKGIRTHRREMRVYKRRVRRFKRAIRKNRVKTTERG